ncbi:MAG: DUF1772 domain-containing protein [Myxococcales bacterium]|nr:DUF1772 domain-containing protein [Myxococcales bacterium]
MSNARRDLLESLLSLDNLTLLTAIGAGVMAGVFFTFSNFVMPALAKLPADQGTAAMQSINVEAINRWFMAALFGTGAACAVLAVLSFRSLGDSRAFLRLGGATLYLLGAIVVTAAFNVPRNDALAAADPRAAETVALWGRYLGEWLRWNHVRTGTSLVSAIALSLAYGMRPG